MNGLVFSDGDDAVIGGTVVSGPQVRRPPRVRRSQIISDQQGLGWMAYEGPAFIASGMERAPIIQAPLIGEHTREISRQLLGQSEEEIERMISAGVLEVTE